MKEIFLRYQFLLGSLLVAAAGFFVLVLFNYRAPVMAPPAYAAAGDVQGSPNVTVAAFPAHSSNGDLVLLKVQSDGSFTLSLSFPPGVKHFLTDEGSSLPSGQVFGSDRRLYEPRGFNGDWKASSDFLP